MSNYMDVLKEGEEWEGMHSRRNVLTTNLVVKPPREKIVAIRGGKYGVFEDINNYKIQKDPGFIDYEGENFMLKEDAEVFKMIEGFETVPFDKMGLYTDEYRTEL